MIGTEFIKGQGLGNQLFCYVTARAIAEENGYEFGTAGQEIFAVNIHNDKGMYFMDVDLGAGIYAGHYVNGTEFGLDTLLVALEAGSGLILVELFVGGIVDDFLYIFDPILGKIQFCHSAKLDIKRFVLCYCFSFCCIN